MNRLVLRVLAVKAAALIAVFSAPAYADGGFHRFVVFGDSLSDPGNWPSRCCTRRNAGPD